MESISEALKTHGVILALFVVLVIGGFMYLRRMREGAAAPQPISGAAAQAGTPVEDTPATVLNQKDTAATFQTDGVSFTMNTTNLRDRTSRIGNVPISSQ